jgi:hypothetical protein
MSGLKRRIRPGLVLSVGVHLGILLVALILASANPIERAPPPEAAVVELVTPEEMARLEGTPSELRLSGSATPSPANGKGPVTQVPQPRPQPEKETRQHQNPERESNEASVPQPPPPTVAQAELVRAEKAEPEEQKQTSEPQNASSPSAQQPPEQPNIANEVSQYVSLGGPLGGGFDAPPIDTNVSGYDWTAQFRERLAQCSKTRIDPNDKVVIKIRISFIHDGTLASAPRLLVATPSPKQQVLWDTAVNALETCQPFTMLPLEKYNQWKTMELYVTPLNMGR